MNETELESLVVRLIGDGASYQKMMEEAQASAKRTTAAIKQDGSHIDGFGDQLSRFGELAVAGLQIWGTVAFLQSGMNAWAEQEAAVIKLNAILETNGRNVEVVGEQYARFSTEMQRVTTMADEVTLGILAQAESFGLTGQAAEEATRASIGLAAINGGNAESYLRFTAAMARGDTEMMKRMARMIPQLRGIKDETELMAKATKLVESGWKTAQMQANTFTGQMKQLSNAWGEILEDVGKFTSEVIKPFVSATKQAVEWMQKLDEKTKNVVIGLAMFAALIVSIGPVMATLNATIVPLIGMIGSGFGVLLKIGLVLVSPFLILKALLIGLAVVVGLVFSPLGAAIAAVALVVMGLVRRFGGTKSVMSSIADFAVAAWTRIKDFAVAAWEYISAKALAFYAWLQPITDAAASFAVTAWGIIKAAAIATWDWIVMAAGVAWDWVSSVWVGIFGDAEISWGDVQDVVQRVILFMEFTLLNFGTVAALVWAGIKLGASMAVDKMRNGFVYLLAAGVATCMTLGRTFASLWEIIRGRGAAPVRGIAEQWRTDFRNVALAMGAGSSELTNRLRREFEAMRGAVSESFEDFVRRRRAEFAALGQDPKEETRRTSPGTHEREEMQKAVKEAEKFDAVLRGSAEALSRIRDYQDRLAGPRTAQSAGGTSTLPSYTPPSAGGAMSTPTPVSVVNTPAQNATQDAICEFVRRIAVATEQTAARPPITVIGVSLS